MCAIASFAWTTQPATYCCRVPNNPGNPPETLLNSAAENIV